MKTALHLAGIVALAVCSAAPASAATIDLATLYGAYDIQDNFTTAGNFFDNDYFASSAVTAKFTDLYVVGDEYEIYVNGVLTGAAVTPLGADTGYFTDDPETAFGSGNYASGLISLLAGDTLSFKITSIPSGFPDATIAVTALSGVPEPSTWAMMIAGIGFAGASLRRRQKVAVRYA